MFLSVISMFWTPCPCRTSCFPIRELGKCGGPGEKYVYVDYEPPEDMPVRRHASYREIRAWILQEHSLGVSPYQVAYVKRKNGVAASKRRNVPPPEPAKAQSVPPEKEAAIEAALRHFGTI